MITVYCKNTKNEKMYSVGKMQSLYTIEEAVLRVSFGLLNFKIQRCTRAYFCFTSRAVYTWQGQRWKVTFNIAEKEGRVFISTPLTGQ
jgi:hypothetical protein